jgi:hypothetical protein
VLAPLGPIDTRLLFPPLLDALLGLLRGLSPDEWRRITVHPGGLFAKS